MSWCYLPDAGIALNVDTVTTVTFLGGTAHVNFLADDHGFLTADSRADVAALIEALGRLTNQRSADAMRARVKPSSAAAKDKRETPSVTAVAR